METYTAFAKQFCYKSKEIFVIFGEHKNGHFGAIINKNVCAELSNHNDKFYNTEKLSEFIQAKSNVNMYVNMIADYKEYYFDEIKINEMSFDFNGYNFLLIIGKHLGSNFFAIPNWGLSSIYIKNTEETTKLLIKLFKKRIDNVTANAIAKLICDN